MTGIRDVGRGWRLLMRRPKWWPLAALPLAINLLLFGAGIYFGFDRIQAYVHSHFSPSEGVWWAAIGWLIYALFWVLALLAVYLLFVLVATVIAAPFNDFLSEKVELDYCGARVDKTSLIRDTSRAIWVGIWSSLRLALTTLVLYAIILPINFIPGFGSVAYFVLSTTITIWFLSLQFTSYSMDRRFYDYRQRKAFMRRNRARTLGLGAISAIMMWVPVLNALFIPVSAVAGTLLFCDTELRDCARGSGGE